MQVVAGGSLAAGLAPGYGAPHHEYPKQNCSVQAVTAEAELCTPAFTTECETISVPVKTVVDKQQCYPVSTAHPL